MEGLDGAKFVQEDGAITLHIVGFYWSQNSLEIGFRFLLYSFLDVFELFLNELECLKLLLNLGFEVFI
jgi:hypothetical protein